MLIFFTFFSFLFQELNLDLVQFPHPVIIYEVRIIPLRAQVQANLAGGVRLGWVLSWWRHFQLCYY